MKKFIVFLIGLFAAQSSLLAQEKSLLWKVSMKGQPDSYLFGTIHAICQSDYLEMELLDQALERSQQLILEVDMNNPQAVANMQSKMILQGDTTLRHWIPNDDDYFFIAEACARYGIAIEEFMRFKPMMLISILSMKSFQCENLASYENNLTQMAQKVDKPVLGLESASYQLNLFDALSSEDIVRMIKATLEEIKVAEQTSAMTQLYRNQDIQGLYEMVAQSAEMKNHQDLFLTKRNQNWAKALPELMNQTSSLIAVGAGHLGGPQGLIALLKSKGYQVVPVKNFP